MENQEFRLGELFCGPGGIALGALQAFVKTKKANYSIIHAWANDYDSDSCDTYTRNICPENPKSVLCSDVRSLDITSLPPIDAFAYGFPCNDFSVVGERRGFDGNFGPLYSYGVNVIDFFKPKFFIAENVGGLASANEGSAFREILSDLRNAGNGYSLTAHLYKFEDYGVPQTRHRIIIVGIDRTLQRIFRVPAPTTSNKPMTARKALENPLIPYSAANHEKTSQSTRVIERLMRTKPGENAWTASLPEDLRLNVKKTRLSHIYRRLHPDKPSYTITGSGGGGTHGYHWDEPRALTNRERARLQTFPDDFIFEGAKESVRKQIGMAVPPLISKIIFTSILKTLADVDYEHVCPSWEDTPELFDHLKCESVISC
ncbi:MAG: DNA cytosine methyltransferase [Verrucomicrobiota bacterium]